MIEPAIHEPPALPTSPVSGSTATIENVAKQIDKVSVRINNRSVLFITKVKKSLCNNM